MTLCMLHLSGIEMNLELPGITLLEQERVDVADSIIRALADNNIEIIDYVWEEAEEIESKA